MGAVRVASRRRAQLPWREVGALALLTAGLAAAPIGPLVGIFLTLRSAQWSSLVKGAVLLYSAAIVAVVRLAPEHGDLSITTLRAALVALTLLVALVLLSRADPRGTEADRVSPLISGFAAFALAGAGWVVAQQLHPVDTYDLTSELVTAARGAERSGDQYGVVSRDSAWLDGNLPDRGDVERLAGYGNDNFEPVWRDLVTADGRREVATGRRTRGGCIVVPVVPHRSSQIESVTALARFCFGLGPTVDVRPLGNR